MTRPHPDTLEREKEKLYLTDAELIRRIGVPDKVFRSILPELEAKYGFPRGNKLFGGLRYWPAVKAFLDKWEGLPNPNEDGQSRGNIRAFSPRVRP